MKIGYIRVSTAEQNIGRQLEALKDITEKQYIDKLSGATADRPQLKEMLEFVREGDCVIVTEISRLARSTKDLLDIVNKLKDSKVQFVSLKESIDTNTDTGKFLLTIFGAIAELERDTLKARQREGIEIAKQKGIYKGRKIKIIDQNKLAHTLNEWANGMVGVNVASERLGISKTLFYRYAERYGFYELKAKNDIENYGASRLMRHKK